MTRTSRETLKEYGLKQDPKDTEPIKDYTHSRTTTDDTDINAIDSNPTTNSNSTSQDTNSVSPSPDPGGDPGGGGGEDQ